MTKNEKIIEQAAEDFEAILNSARSVQLATQNADGRAEASYAPVYIDPECRLHVLISEIAEHTDNMIQTKHASAMVIEDESATSHIFARRRATFDCTAHFLETGSSEWTESREAFKAHFSRFDLGEFVEGLFGMADFHLVRLTPQRGRLVTGFGRAFNLSGEAMRTIEHFRGASGKGHRKREEN